MAAGYSEIGEGDIAIHVIAQEQEARRRPAFTEPPAYWAWFPTGVFLVTRLLDAIVIHLASSSQIALEQGTLENHYIHTPKPADPGYFGVITNWDGQWYQSIAVDGYRSPDSSEPSTRDSLWAWAFPPLFPMVVRGLMSLTGLPFALAASVVNLVAGSLAMVVLYLLVRRTAGRFAASASVVLTCCFVSAPLLQVAYSESLSLLLLCCTFLLISVKRYWLALPLIMLLALTRLITPPLALVILAHGLWRMKKAAGTPIAKNEYLAMGLSFAMAVGGIFLWSGIVSSFVGSGTGATQRPISTAEQLYVGWFTETARGFGWIGPFTLGLIVFILLTLAYTRFTQSWGVELRTWLWAYPLYIFAATPMTTGVLRYMLLWPSASLLVVGSMRKASGARVVLISALALAGLTLQALWVQKSFVITEDFWMP